MAPNLAPVSMSAQGILRECGLEAYAELIQTQGQDESYLFQQRTAAAWAPETAFPGPLLQAWYLQHREGQATEVSGKNSVDDLSSKLPIEVIERIFSALQMRELYYLTHMNRALSVMALARLYHNINLSAHPDTTRLLRCLNTLANVPKLSRQVCTAEVDWRNEDGIDLAPEEVLLNRALAALYPHAYSVWVRGFMGPSGNLVPRVGCLRLRSLRLENPHRSRRKTPQMTSVALLLVHLEAHVTFVHRILPHVPNLRALVVVAYDTVNKPSDTQLMSNLQHATVRRVSLVITWPDMGDPSWIRDVITDGKDFVGQLPGVRHLTFVVGVPPWGDLPNMLFVLFLQKFPSTETAIIESLHARPLDMAVVSHLAPNLVDVVLQREHKEWIKDPYRGRWQCFDQIGLLNAMRDIQATTNAEEVTAAFAACVEQTIYING